MKSENLGILAILIGVVVLIASLVILTPSGPTFLSKSLALVGVFLCLVGYAIEALSRRTKNPR
ncbi:MAG: hypothetical protein A2633_06160 [Candidatus Sungbacteria bacterium RIFCSPHIGHO2_01_FULL_47_32]|uniref:Uncharacterized protein n=1 Tax=Candidatus Sungbacteria bacterium RIFCSPHIGHO2_01_FULL_47_32 TaxID=1802264 RepID=A0A1G2KA36_9BACT|nr:MAG: hypothetical protein UX72_C0001G0070 [Parcubacteria group bacterium GW2011_GWA2_47_10]OGZ95278.1 MAG: hypothetical protein A2633_06160 [Candidatus Sungbacteria bacterium RIFCSPHIGHO2_01_FULL_47_32]